MNTRRKWDSKTKATIILEGLKGRSVAGICTEYDISQIITGAILQMA